MKDKLQEARDAFNFVKERLHPNQLAVLRDELETIQTALDAYEKQLAGDNQALQTREDMVFISKRYLLDLTMKDQAQTLREAAEENDHE